MSGLSVADPEQGSVEAFDDLRIFVTAEAGK
jgi:hypothetical protein